jgi:hypothetical protein
MHATGWPEVGIPASMSACDPQQSLSVTHVSPSTWQPVAGWQISTPVGPHGAHRRLQQLPPHPPSPAGELQSCPSAAEQFPPNANWPQVPTLAPVGIVQVPTQQSPLVWHASPVCPQNDEGWQMLPLQNPEQQALLAVQALPSVLQVGLSAAHLPLVQVPLQH